MITSLFSLIMFDNCLSKVSKKLFDKCFEEFGGRYNTHVMIDLEFCDIISKHTSWISWVSPPINYVIFHKKSNFSSSWSTVFSLEIVPRDIYSFIKVSLTANILMLCFKINKDNNCSFPFNPLTFWCTIVNSRLFQGPGHFSMSPALYKNKNNHNRHKSHNSKRPHSMTINDSIQRNYASRLVCDINHKRFSINP